MIEQNEIRWRLSKIIKNNLLVDERVLERRNTLAYNNGECERLTEGSNVTQSHDTRQTVVTASLSNVVHHRSDTAGVNL